MVSIQFLPVPEDYQTGIAPDWDFELLTEWLQKLTGAKPELACEKICKLLLHLSHADLPADIKAKFLEEIARHIEIIEGKLEALYLDLPAPMPDSLFKGLQWLIWSYYLIAGDFLRLAKNYSEPEKGRKAIFLYRALLALRQTYRHISASYFLPMSGFWLLCYEVYGIAEREGLAEITFSHEQNHSVTINGLFKSILAFSLCDFQQFRPREMRQLFAITEHFSEALEINRLSSSDTGKNVYFVDLQEDRQPARVAGEAELEQNVEHRFFTPLSLAKAMHQGINDEREKSRFLNLLTKESLSRLIKTLGQAQKRLHRRLPDNSVGLGLAGFSNILQYLDSGDGGEADSEPESVSVKPVKPYDYDTSQFSLVENGEEFIFQMNDRMREQYVKDNAFGKIVKASGDPRKNVDIWNNTAVDNDVKKPDSLAFFNSSASGYGILLNLQQAQVKIGDLFAIIPESQEGIELTVIRHLQRVTAHSLNLGVELIAPVGKAVRVQGSTSRTRAVFVPGIKALQKADSLIFSFPQFKIGEMVEFKKDDRLVIGLLHKTLISTASFCQMEICYPNEAGVDH